MIFVTGDCHSDFRRFNTETFPIQKELTKDDTVIILGDFGGVWNRDDEDKRETYWLDWLNEKPFTVCFIDGNHENHQRLATYPKKEWKGGMVHEIRPSVLHLMRGEVFAIDGATFFAFGGASSHDICDGILDYEDEDWKKKAKELESRYKFMYRVKGLSWWEEELPSEEEMKRGLSNLKKHGNQVDYILSHSPSTSELYLMGGKGLYEPDRLTDYLEEIKATVSYRKHYFGHMHVNREINDKDICLYEQILCI